MHQLEVIEFKPIDPVLLGYVETYKWIFANESIQVRTIPNGRLDAWISLSGDFWWQQQSAGHFRSLPACGFFPLTRQSHRAKAEKGFHCISIKFFPHVLTLPIMSDLQLNEPLGFTSVFDGKGCGELMERLLATPDPLQQRPLLDKFFSRELFQKGAPDQWMRQLITALETGDGTSMSVSQIASANHVTVKTLERRFTKVFGISPKLFADLLRLQRATRNIRQAKQDAIRHGDLTEALGYGYYDQSHFVKACKKIAGLTPKQLFTQLPARVTDFLVE